MPLYGKINHVFIIYHNHFVFKLCVLYKVNSNYTLTFNKCFVLFVWWYRTNEFGEKRCHSETFRFVTSVWALGWDLSVSPSYCHSLLIYSHIRKLWSMKYVLGWRFVVTSGVRRDVELTHDVWLRANNSLG